MKPLWWHGICACTWEKKNDGMKKNTFLWCNCSFLFLLAGFVSTLDAIASLGMLLSSSPSHDSQHWWSLRLPPPLVLVFFNWEREVETVGRGELRPGEYLYSYPSSSSKYTFYFLSQKEGKSPRYRLKQVIPYLGLDDPFIHWLSYYAYTIRSVKNSNPTERAVGLVFTYGSWCAMFADVHFFHAMHALHWYNKSISIIYIILC